MFKMEYMHENMSNIKCIKYFNTYSTFFIQGENWIQTSADNHIQGVLALCEFHYCEFHYCGFSKLLLKFG